MGKKGIILCCMMGVLCGGIEMTKENKGAVRAVSFMMVITLVGKILGLVREQFLANNYATGMEANAFMIASMVPRVFFDAVFASAISASFIPVFNEYMSKKGKEEAFKLSGTFITLIGVLTSFLTVFGIIFSHKLVFLFADGFNQETAALCANLLRILFPTVVFTGVAFSFVGILQSLDEFNVPAAMSIASNLVIIIYFIFFNKFYGVYGLTIAFLIGWAMQAIIQLPSLKKKGYVYKPNFNFKDEGIKKIMLLMLPVMVSTWVQPINLVINTKFASRLLDGSGVSALGYANTIYSIIVGVFVLSVANVIFPKLSRMTLGDDGEGFSSTLNKTLEAMAFLLIPMMVGVMCLSEPIVRLLLERGKLGPSETTVISSALFYFSIGMIGFGLQTVLSRAFYAKQEGKIPLISGAVSIGVNVLLCSFLSSPMGIGGLALASALSSTIGALILLFFIQKENKVLTKNFYAEVLKMLVCVGIMAAAVLGIKSFLGLYFGTGFIETLILTGISAFVGIIVYGLSCIVFSVSLVKYVLNFAGTRKER